MSIPELPNVPFLIYRSSAGSGKTFTLAVSYVELALRHPGAFSSILAVTFTNKATEEMKLRILEYLHQLARGEENAVRKRLLTLHPEYKTDLQYRARASLKSILHQYARFQVSTIDSFFQRIIRSFARDVQLRGAFRIELDQEKVLQAITDKMEESLGEKEPVLTRWVREFAVSRLRDGKSWDFRKEIIRSGGEMFSNQFISQKLADEPAFNSDQYQQFQKDLAKRKFRYEQQLIVFSDRAEEISRQFGLTIDDFYYKGNGFYYLFTKIREVWEYSKEKLINNRVREVLEKGPERMTGSPAAEEAGHHGLYELLQETVDYIEQWHTEYVTACVIYDQIYLTGIFHFLYDQIRSYRDQEEVMLISETQLFLNQILGESDTPFIYERIGTYIRHYLIDEFQDTSFDQWSSFLPLIQNSLAEGHRNLVVGDMKQSIYRFRGGQADIMLRQLPATIQEPQRVEIPLQFNYRSKERIVQFNNKFFEAAVRNVRVALETGLKKKKEPDGLSEQTLHTLHFFEQVYKDVRQKAFHTGPGGWIRMVCIPEPEESMSELKTSFLEKIPAWLEMLQDSGYALRDIGILVRKREEGSAVARYLQQFVAAGKGRPAYSYQVISQEALLLTHAASVNVLLAVLRLVIQPKELFLRLNLLEWWWQLHPVQPDQRVQQLEILDSNRWKTLFPPAFAESFSSYRHMPLTELINRLIAHLKLGDQKGEVAYQMAFQDAIIEFSGQESSDIPAFLAWFEEIGDRRALDLPEEQDAAQVLTLHKCKGLQYRVVILPFCSWAMYRSMGTLWIDPPQGWTSLKSLQVKKVNKLYGSHFSAALEKEYVQSALDELNLLYVAFTRAREGLIAGCFPAAQGASIGEVIMEILQQEPGMDFQITQQDKFTIYQSGEWPVVEQNVQKPSDFWTPRMPSGHSASRLQIRKRGGDMLSFTSQDLGYRISYGKWLHEIFSRIRTREDLPGVIQELRTEDLLDGMTREALETEVQACLNHPVAGKWFEDKSYEVFAERPIITPGGQQYQPDRVMIRGNEAIVVDFKTGLEEASHRRQVKKYMNLLQDMGYRSRGFLWYLTHNTVEEV